MSFRTLWRCFPPTRAKKQRYLEELLLARLLAADRGIVPVEPPSAPSRAGVPHKPRPQWLRRWNHLTNRLSLRWYARITYAWDRGEGIHLTGAEEARLLQKYGYRRAPPSR